jgi:hypothetical protein
MDQPPPPFRQLIEEHQFLEELRAIVGNARRADEFVDGARWVLQRDPTVGVRISKHVWFYPVVVSNSLDAVVLYYTFDKEHVYFLSIRKTEYPPRETGE